MDLEVLDCPTNGYWTILRVEAVDLLGDWSFTVNGSTLTVRGIIDPVQASLILENFLRAQPVVYEVYRNGDRVEVTFHARPSIVFSGVEFFPEIRINSCAQVDLNECPEYCDCEKLCLAPMCPTGVLIYNLLPNTQYSLYLKNPHFYEYYLVTTDSSGTLWKQKLAHWNFFYPLFIYLRNMNTGQWHPVCYRVELSVNTSGPIKIY